MSLGVLLVLALSFLACGGGSRELREQVESSEAVEASQRTQTEQLNIDVNQLLTEYDQVTQRFREVESNFHAAKERAGTATSNYSAAEMAYEDAERNWRWMTYVLVAAATYDLAGEVCATVESTQQYRQRVGLVGNSGVCVDHSFAHALGGVNHPWNYVPLDCRVNSSYGAAFWSKFVDMPVEMLRGLAVSTLARLRCGSRLGAWKR